MTYVIARQGEGTSTTLVSVRVPLQHLRFAKEAGFVLNKWANACLDTLIHELQTDHVSDHDKLTLMYGESSGFGIHHLHEDRKPTMFRLQTHHVQYLKLNQFKVGTALNMAFQLWTKYYLAGSVADYKIHSLKQRTKW